MNKKLYYKQILFFILILFILTRILIFNFIGYNNVIDFFHFSNLELLRTDLIRTIYYNHSQPLLLNFLLGLFLKIFDGNKEKISILFFFIHLCLTIGIILISYKIMRLFNLNKYILFFILLFLVFNPNLVYYENYSNPIYSHINCFLYFLLAYLILRYCLKYSPSDEILIYVTLLIQSQIWGAWQPYLIIVLFCFFRIFFNKIDKKKFIIFFIIFILSLTPSIKNFILFSTFSNSSWTGIYLSTVLVPEPECANHKLTKKDIINAKNNFKNDYFKQPSLWGPQSGENNLAIIEKSKRCFKYAISKIIEDPLNYLKNRLIQFFISHSKFSFENVRGAPEIGKPKWIINYLDIIDVNFKILKQSIIFLYMITIYILYSYMTVKQFKNGCKFRYFNLIIIIIHLHYLAITHLPNGHYENTRMVYGGFVIQLIFFCNLFKLKRNN
jgi:hypothetical protein